MISECDYQGCDEEAEFIDEMGSLVCNLCMIREVEDDGSGVEYEDFESIAVIE